MSANFDPVASEYDALFTDTFIGKAQRNLIWKHLKRDLSVRPLKILEINCGTGLDAEFFNNMGHQVVATDISPEMIVVAKQKRSSEIHFQVVGFQDLKRTFEGQTFDLIFSNFAGLNCVSPSQLKELQKDFSVLLKPNGRFIGVFLGEYCWQERLYFRLKNQPENVNRRLSVSEANLDGKSVQQTHCFAPSALKDVFKDFDFIQQKPIGLLVPPSYFEAQLKHWPWFVRLLQITELYFSPSSLANRADHFFMEFRKK